MGLHKAFMNYKEIGTCFKRMGRLTVGTVGIKVQCMKEEHHLLLAVGSNLGAKGISVILIFSLYFAMASSFPKSLGSNLLPTPPNIFMDKSSSNINSQKFQ